MTAWTSERIEQLTKLWADPSLTAAAIARIMGINVSSVTGKRYYLNLPPRSSPILNSTRGVWTSERTETLIKLWTDPSLSCIDIGRIMNLSVSSIVSKRRNLDLPSRGSPLKPRGSGVYPRHLRPTPKVEEPETPAPEPPWSTPEAPPIEAPPHEAPGPRGCQFIAGDVRKPGWSFCDKPGFPWCEQHRRRVFDKVPRVYGYDRV